MHWRRDALLSGIDQVEEGALSALRAIVPGAQLPVDPLHKAPVFT